MRTRAHRLVPYLLGFASVGLALTLAVNAEGVKVPNKVPHKVEPFDLADTTLLDGPFREAMLRDQQYLLSLDQDRLLHNFRVTAGLPSSATAARRMGGARCRAARPQHRVTTCRPWR